MNMENTSDKSALTGIQRMNTLTSQGKKQAITDQAFQ